MNKYKEEHLDIVFQALSDPTRRKVIETLYKQEQTVLELANLFDMSFQAVAKHLNVLNKANLINKQREGKYQVCTFNPEPMTEAIKWISEHHELWVHSFNSLEKILKKKNIRRK